VVEVVVVEVVVVGFAGVTIATAEKVSVMATDDPGRLLWSTWAEIAGRSRT
jgi:hypothetical protein